jgi:hypothetical protein
MIRKANCRALGASFGAILLCCIGLVSISGAQTPGAMLGPIQRIQGAGMVQRAGAAEFQALAFVMGSITNNRDSQVAFSTIDYPKHVILTA